MLIEFSCANYKSIRDKQTLSMVATKSKSKFPEVDNQNVFIIDDDLSLLKTVAIYGANGSGKTNVAVAMAVMRRFVSDSSRETQFTDSIPVEPFLLDVEMARKPTFFQMVFLLEGKQYRYGFEADSEQVHAEWLFHVPTIKEARLFERTNERITVSQKFNEGKGLEEKTRRNALFLSVVAQFNGNIAQKILNWFANFNVVSGLDDKTTRSYTINCLKSNENADDIRSFVKKLDLGIDDIQVEETVMTADELPPSMPEKLKAAILETTTVNKASVKTFHRSFSGSAVLKGQVIFDMQSESEGTQKLFSLAGPLMDTLKNGKILVIDEMDARLHPLITAQIIQLFNSSETNAKNAQLVFATHDTNLLNNRTFRRDQIWFTEKDTYGATHLFSLVEYKVRNDASFESDYIQGRFGAIPFIGDFKELFEESHG